MKCRSLFWGNGFKGPPGGPARFEQGANDEEGFVCESCADCSCIRRPALRRDFRVRRELHPQGGYARDGGTGEHPGVRMVVQVGGGFILDQQNFGGTNITDHGHIHYFVDGVYKGATWLTEFVFSGLTPGPHTLKAELHYDDHGLVVPIVADSVQVTAGTPSIKILEPTNDLSVSSLGFRLRVAVTNFTMSALDFGGWNLSGEGHMHIFDVVGTNEIYKAATPDTTFVVSGWSVGPHTLKAELYNNNHTELPTDYSDSVNITVAAPSIALTAPTSIVQGQDLTLTWTVAGFVMDAGARSEEHTSELQSPCNLVCRLLLEKKKNNSATRAHRLRCNLVR